MSPKFSDDEAKQTKKEDNKYIEEEKKEKQKVKNELKGKMRQAKKMDRRP
jgi:hypothetical protein